MKTRYLIQFAPLFLSLTIALGLGAGGCGTSGGNPQAVPATVSLQVASYSAQYNIFDYFIPSAYAALTGAKICFKRLRFKASPNDLGAAAGADLVFEPGEITFGSASTSTLGQVNISPGTYRRVEFDLAKNGAGCTSGYSVSFSNSNGTYSSSDGATIKFEGTFIAMPGNQILSLGIQSIVDALNTVSGPSGNNSNIKNLLEDASVKGKF